MRLTSIVSVAAAAVVGLTLFELAPADAAQRRSFSAGRAPSVRQVQPRVMQRRVNPTPRITKAPRIHKAPTKTFKAEPRILKKQQQITKIPHKGAPSVLSKGKGTPSVLSKKAAGVNTGTLNLRRLPLHKAAAGNKLLRGRVHVPQRVKPKLTLAKLPGAPFRHRFSPFVQRHWKKAFFWVAVAGIGYLTVPALYYDRFYTCVNVDDPIYDDCIGILSHAALEEEEVVHVSMPTGANYRYRASAPVRQQDCPTCRWDRYVERKWNQSFAWVKIPDAGNVTVPDAYYDRFYTFAAANPPNYPEACRVLDEAASVRDERDVVRVSMPPDAEYRYQVDAAKTADCKTCNMEPFVERKWNREFVWVQIPQTGNVTVPEDYYDRFHGYASSEPPNYPAACNVLVEAAAADTVMTTALDTRRGDE
jgi:hypothetical protein